MRALALGRTIELLLLGGAAGIATVAIAVTAALGRRLIEIERVPLLGMAVASVTTLLALARRPLDGAVVLGLGLLLIPFFVPNKPDQRYRALAAIPGAAVLAFAAPSGEGGLEWLVLFSVPILGAMVADFDAAHIPPSYGAIGLGTVTVAAFLSIPDTQNIAAMTGIAAVVGLGAWVFPQLALGGSAFVWVGLLMWIVTADGSARPASAVGVVGAFGLMALEPILRRVGRSPEGMLVPPEEMPTRRWSFFYGTTQGAIAVVAARTAGVRMSAVVALTIVVVLWALVAAGLAVGSRRLATM